MMNDQPKEWVIRNIPFYNGDPVRNIIGGTLRGRGNRCGFKKPMSGVYTVDGKPHQWQYHNMDLMCYLPKHLSEKFTLYTLSKAGGGRPKQHTDFQRINRKGKVVIRLAV
jgi:hypothetical protein